MKIHRLRVSVALFLAVLLSSCMDKEPDIIRPKTSTVEFRQARRGEQVETLMFDKNPEKEYKEWRVKHAQDCEIIKLVIVQVPDPAADFLNPDDHIVSIIHITYVPKPAPADRHAEIREIDNKMEASDAE